MDNSMQKKSWILCVHVATSEFLLELFLSLFYENMGSCYAALFKNASIKVIDRLLEHLSGAIIEAKLRSNYWIASILLDLVNCSIIFHGNVEITASKPTMKKERTGDNCRPFKL